MGSNCTRAEVPSDKQVNKKKSKKEDLFFRILVADGSCSGKTTLLKNAKHVFHKSITKEELLESREKIREAV